MSRITFSAGFLVGAVSTLLAVYVGVYIGALKIVEELADDPEAGQRIEP